MTDDWETAMSKAAEIEKEMKLTEYDRGREAGYVEGHADGVEYAQSNLGLVIDILKQKLSRYEENDLRNLERERAKLDERIEKLQRPDRKPLFKTLPPEEKPA